MLVSRREGRPALIVARRRASIKNEWTRGYSARLTMSSRRIELRETREVIKETDGRRTLERAACNVIARRPKADVAIQSRRSCPSPPGLLRFARNDERGLVDRITI
jgi:hypothetical protein